MSIRHGSLKNEIGLPERERADGSPPASAAGPAAAAGGVVGVEMLGVGKGVGKGAGRGRKRERRR